MTIPDLDIRCLFDVIRGLPREDLEVYCLGSTVTMISLTSVVVGRAGEFMGVALPMDQVGQEAGDRIQDVSAHVLEKVQQLKAALAAGTN